MKILNTAKAKPGLMSTLERLALYSGMDNLTLFEINDGLEELFDEKREAVYRFELELQAALLDMSLNGIHVDVNRRQTLQRDYSAKVAKLKTILNELLQSIGYFDYYVNMACHEFSAACDIAPDLLPRSWEEWKERPSQFEVPRDQLVAKVREILEVQDS